MEATPAVALGVGFAAAVPLLHLACARRERSTASPSSRCRSTTPSSSLGLCLVMGYAGQVSLGHGAFFAMGGYTSAVLTTHDFSPVADARRGCLAEASPHCVRQDPVRQHRSSRFRPGRRLCAAMVLTFADRQPDRLSRAAAARPLPGHGHARLRADRQQDHRSALPSPGAADGINGVPEWKLGLGLTVSGKRPCGCRTTTSPAACCWCCWCCCAIWSIPASAGRCRRFTTARTAANAMGINTAAYKLKAFVLSALLAAMAGVFFTHYTGGIGPSEAGALKSVRYVALAAAGRHGESLGRRRDEHVLNYLSLARLFGSYDNAVFGALLIVIVSLAPAGPLQAAGAVAAASLLGTRRPAVRSNRAASPRIGRPGRPWRCLKWRTSGAASAAWWQWTRFPSESSRGRSRPSSGRTARARPRLFN